jgi:hypothetical protein
MRTTVLTLLATATFASPAYADPAPPGRNAYGATLDIDAFCAATFGADFRANLIGYTVFAWQCTNGTQSQRFSPQAACLLQGTGQFGFGAFDDPYSWFCGPGAGQTNRFGLGLDLEDFCEINFGLDARAVLVTQDAAGWRCRDSGGDHAIDLNRACAVQQGLPLARVGDPSDYATLFCAAQ